LGIATAATLCQILPHTVCRSRGSLTTRDSWLAWLVTVSFLMMIFPVPPSCKLIYFFCTIIRSEGVYFNLCLSVRCQQVPPQVITTNTNKVFYSPPHGASTTNSVYRAGGVTDTSRRGAGRAGAPEDTAGKRRGKDQGSGAIEWAQYVETVV
jgi:hypothetical protein